MNIFDRVSRVYYAPEDGTGTGDGTGNHPDSDPNASGDGSKLDFGKALAELPEDNRQWLSKQGFDKAENLSKLARHAHEQEKLIGSSIRVPKDDAPPEERDAFLTKLGRPADAEGYDFEVPDALPESLPYDGERAGEFKAKAYELGLSKKQAAALHDWFVGTAVDDFTNAEGQQAEAMAELAVFETKKLEKVWGPLTGETAKANMEFANRFIRETGGEALVEALKRRGLIGPNKEILDETIAVSFATAGASLFKEGDVLRGQTGNVLGNPFADGDAYNETEQAKIVRRDPDEARALIAAAGKKPSDVGLEKTLG